RGRPGSNYGRQGGRGNTVTERYAGGDRQGLSIFRREKLLTSPDDRELERPDSRNDRRLSDQYHGSGQSSERRRAARHDLSWPSEQPDHSGQRAVRGDRLNSLL